MKLEPDQETTAAPAGSAVVVERSTDEPRPPRRRRRRLIVLIAVAIVLAAGIGVALYVHYRGVESTDDAFIEGRVTAVSPKVSAHVVRLLVDDNEDVAQDQLLLELDPRDFDVRLAQSRARLAAAESQLASAQANIERAKAEVESAAAEVASAETEADRAKHDYERYVAAGEGAVTRQSLDNARALAVSTAAQLRAAREKAVAARSQVPYAESQVAVARAEIEQARAQAREAELQLSYTRVLAPVAGRVTRRAVEKGDYVQPGQQLFALVEKNVWVIANFRETQLREMRAGERATIRIDAYPDRRFRGHVDGIMRGTGSRFSLLPPENATGNYVKVVQRVPVKILFDEDLPPELEIGVGMSVVPEVRVR